jgi:hypothetical protein
MSISSARLGRSLALPQYVNSPPFLSRTRRSPWLIVAVTEDDVDPLHRLYGAKLGQTPID